MQPISGEETMKALTERLVGARRTLFSHYHIGGCSSCAYRDDETLAEVCKRNELPLAEVIGQLESSEENDRRMLLEPAQASQWVRQGVPLFDIRTREEFEAVAIPGSTFMTQEEQEKLLSETNATRKLILCDHRGRHVLDRVSWFRGHGMLETYGISGGIDAWATQVDSSLRRYELEF